MNKVHTAFKQGVAYMLGFSLALQRRNNLAYDEAKWITLHPNGKGVNNKGQDIKGSHVLIDSESGEILGGLGGKFTGRHISAVPKQGRNEQHNAQATIEYHKDKRKKEALKQQAQGQSNQIDKATQEAQESVEKAQEQSKEFAEKQQANNNKPQGAQIDLTLPNKVDKDFILQDRDRSSELSMGQIRNIANKLDYYLVGPSNDFNNGAPVVAYGEIPSENFGRKSIVATQDGKRYTVQYAVIDSAKANASHDSLGNKNEDYFSEDPKFTRAIAGNGRLAGIQRAYQHNPERIEQYKQDLLEDPSHGVSSDVIKGMKQPILVRVMQPKDVSSDIGSQSNISNTLRKSTVEIADDDIRRVDVSKLKTYSDGMPTKEAIEDFISGLPMSDRGDLLTKEGNPTRHAQDRLMNAILLNAYGVPYLVQQRGEVIDPEGKTLLSAMERSAQNMAKLQNELKEFKQLKEKMVARDPDLAKIDAPYDLKEELGEMFLQARDPKFNGQWNAQMFNSDQNNEIQKKIGTLLSDNKTSITRLTTIFNTIAETFSEATKKQINKMMHGGQFLGDDHKDLHTPSKLEIVDLAVNRAKEKLEDAQPKKSKGRANQAKDSNSLSIRARLENINRILEERKKRREKCL